jgi:hypothetical protein
MHEYDQRRYAYGRNSQFTKRLYKICCVMIKFREYRSVANTPKAFIHSKQATVPCGEQESSHNCNVAYSGMRRRRMNRLTGNRIISTMQLSAKAEDGVRPKVMIRYHAGSKKLIRNELALPPYKI